MTIILALAGLFQLSLISYLVDLLVISPDIHLLPSTLGIGFFYLDFSMAVIGQFPPNNRSHW